jgi:hypothetical protein
MKKQNMNKLAFNKADVTELNKQQLKSVNGGASTMITVIGPMSPISCTFCVSSSNGGHDNEYFQMYN